MAQVQQRVLIRSRFLGLAGAVAMVWGLACPAPAAGAKFYDDDPLWQMPKAVDAGKPISRKLSEYYDFFYMTFGQPGEKSTPAAPIKAVAINTLGEVPDSDWYTNRHARKRMSIEELVRGPGDSNAPAAGQWHVTDVKSEGVTPGFVIKDSKGRKYQIKFDTHENFEISTGADVMGSKFFYALGYFTPENYIVYFNPERLVVDGGIRFVDYRGVQREMRQSDVDRVLANVPRDPAGRLRGVASLYISGKPLGPFRYHGMRTDDPNDIFLHEHRRDLRGLKVFSAWLNHTDSKSLNSLDTLVQLDGRSIVRHYLLDFSAAFGADAFEPKSPRAGNVYMLDWKDSAKSFFTLGLYVPEWARANYSHVRGAGRIESDIFDPQKWKSHYYNPAFENCLPDDGFWAAKQVMSFTEPEIRALVETARYTDKAAVDHFVQVMVERQRKIGERYFSQVLPLDNIRVEAGKLVFDDLGVKYGFSAARSYAVEWFHFDNDSEKTTPLEGASSSMSLPKMKGKYIAAKIRAEDPNRSVMVYVRSRSGNYEVVGVERSW